MSDGQLPRDARRGAMRLAIIVRTLAPYRNQLYDQIALRLQATDAVTIFTADAGSHAHYPWEADALRFHHARVVYVPALRGKRGWLAKDWPNFLLWGCLSNFNPTHVWIHEFSPYVLLGLGWAKMHGRPCFVSTELGDRFPGKYTSRNKHFHNFIKRRCEGVLACTQDAYETAQRLGRRALFVPHAIDTTVFVPRVSEENGLRGKAVRFLQVGLLGERKGVDLLLQAFRQCVDSNPDGLELVLLGGGEPSWTRGLIRSLDLESQVRVRPFVQGADLVAEYQRADLFVLASREDTFAVVVHEAAACGLPLVVSRYAGASETLVEEGRNGFVVDPHDTKAFGETLLHLASNPCMWKAFGERARCRAELFSVQASAQQAAAWLRASSWRVP